MTPHWKHFVHQADIGVRGIGNDLSEAFTGAALTLTAVITEPETISAREQIKIHYEAPDIDLLLVDWLNALVYEMATRKILFSQFEVNIKGTTLDALCWGEQIDLQRHHPVVEIKGATYTELLVRQDNDKWIAQTVVDV